MQTYFLVQAGDRMPRWCQLGHDGHGETCWIDFKGRRIPKDGVRLLAHVDGESVNATITDVPAAVAKLERDMAFRHLLDPWSDQGWISPEGRFYGCAFFAHDDLATSMLRKTVGELEWAGWVRVHADSYRRGELRRGMTSRQIATLEALGFTDVDGWGPRTRYEADRSAPAPSFAVEVPEGLAKPVSNDPEDIAAPGDGPTTAEGAFAALVQRLRSDGRIGPLFEDGVELIPDVGGGTWQWMLRFSDMDIGSPEEPVRLLSATGMHLRQSAFDTIEAAPWPFAGIHVDADALALLVVRARREVPKP